MQAADEARTELFEWFSSTVCNRDQRLGSASPFRDRVLALWWSLNLREEVFPEEFGDLAGNVLHD